MSALGQKQTCAAHKSMSALPLIATVKADIAVLTEGGAFRLCPVPQTSTYSAIARASSTSMPRYRTVFSILVRPSKSWTARRIPVDQCKAMSAFTVAVRGKADMPVCTAHVRF